MGQTDNQQIKLFQMVVSTLRKKPSRVEELVGKVYDHEFIKEGKWTTLRFSFNLLFLRVVLKKFYWAGSIQSFKDMLGKNCNL